VNHFLRKIIQNDSDIDHTDYDFFLTSVWENSADKHALIAFLAALSAKPLNLNDVLGVVRFIEKVSPKRCLTCCDRIVNVVGTGGGRPSFNISTTAAFVAAAAGATVLKSGSYAHSSQCGSLDVLDHLGIRLNTTDTMLEAMLAELNIGFVGPQLYSPLLRRIAVSIAPLSLREIGGFINRIGPLLCPFHVDGQVVGVNSDARIDIFAAALGALGNSNSIVVWSEIGLDEFSAVGINRVAAVDQQIRRDTLDPQTLGLNYDEPALLAGGDARANAAIMRSVLKMGCPAVARDTVALNAAALLKLSGRGDSIEACFQLAQEVLASGKAYRLLQDAAAFSHDCAIEGAIP
jgi:anthranilate phosphoribosyltransferase